MTLKDKITQVMCLRGVSENTVRRWLKSGILDHPKTWHRRRGTGALVTIVRGRPGLSDKLLGHAEYMRQWRAMRNPTND